MSKHNGVIVYKIYPDGCLNGVYSNDDKSNNNEIFNEIARKKHKSEDEDEILGVYTCSYIDLASEAYKCDLEIKIGKKAQYDFIWYETGQRDKPDKIKFTGIGWRTSKNKITVSYSYFD